jgi:hypothetical protein
VKELPVPLIDAHRQELMLLETDRFTEALRSTEVTKDHTQDFLHAMLKGVIS